MVPPTEAMAIFSSAHKVRDPLGLFPCKPKHGLGRRRVANQRHRRGLDFVQYRHEILIELLERVRKGQPGALLAPHGVGHFDAVTLDGVNDVSGASHPMRAAGPGALTGRSRASAWGQEEP